LAVCVWSIGARDAQVELAHIDLTEVDAAKGRIDVDTLVVQRVKVGEAARRADLKLERGRDQFVFVSVYGFDALVVASDDDVGCDVVDIEAVNAQSRSGSRRVGEEVDAGAELGIQVEDEVDRVAPYAWRGEKQRGTQDTALSADITGIGTIINERAKFW
jgi:hypothetical protein